MDSSNRKDISLLIELLQRNPCDICHNVIRPDAIIVTFVYHDRKPIICHYSCDRDGDTVSEMMADARRKLDREVLRTHHRRKD